MYRIVLFYNKICIHSVLGNLSKVAYRLLNVGIKVAYICKKQSVSGARG